MAGLAEGQGIFLRVLLFELFWPFWVSFFVSKRVRVRACFNRRHYKKGSTFRRSPILKKNHSKPLLDKPKKRQCSVINPRQELGLGVNKLYFENFDERFCLVMWIPCLIYTTYSSIHFPPRWGKENWKYEIWFKKTWIEFSFQVKKIQFFSAHA